MNLRTIFKVQGIILAINGLAGIFAGTAFFSAAGWEVTADMLTLGQIFGLTLLIIGIWAWRIPDTLGPSYSYFRIVSTDLPIETSYVLKPGQSKPG